MHHAVQAAIARFPDREHVIEELATADDDFLTLCEDLVEAQAALERWKSSDTAAGLALSAEYRELVSALVAELRNSLDRRANA